MRKGPTEAGQALVLVALSMVALLGFLGLVMDLGYLRTRKRQVQQGADAAAIAAAQQVTSCGSSPSCGVMTRAASQALSENGYTGAITTLTQAGGSCAGSLGSDALAVAVNNPPCFMGSTSTDPHYHNAHYVEVVVSQKEPLMFARVFGLRNFNLVARSEAAPSSGSNVMYALNSSAGSAISLVLGAVGSNGGVVDESASSSAFTCFLGIFSAPYIGVVGNNGSFLCSFPGGHPQTHITTPSPADPLAYLQPALAAGAPSPSHCGSGTGRNWTGSPSALNVGSSGWTLNPGTYCGGININPGANVTFNPGIYTLTSTSGSDGGLSVYAGATVSANGVGFYNYGPRGGVSFVCPSCSPGSIAFTAPNAANCAGCADAWQGILFYQDPGDTATSIVVGSSTYNVAVTGASYFPEATVQYALDFAVDYNLLVADKIQLGVQWGYTTINSNFYNDFSSLANGSPIKATNATIVE